MISVNNKHNIINRAINIFDMILINTSITRVLAGVRPVTDLKKRPRSVLNSSPVIKNQYAVVWSRAVKIAQR